MTELAVLKTLDFNIAQLLDGSSHLKKKKKKNLAPVLLFSKIS